MGYSLIYMPVLHFDDINGRPLVGGKLYTYWSGTNTPAPTYRNKNGTEHNENPIRLNERGECVCFINDGLKYKFVLKDALDNTIWEQDNVSIPASEGGGGGGGSEVIVVPILTSGTEIADVFINDERFPLYAPTPLELGETSTTAYPGDMGKAAAELADTANTEAVKNVAYDSVNKKITKTINGTTTEVVSAATLKTDMSLNNVNNTSDADKPVSTAQQTALDLKLDKTGDGKDVTATFTEAATRTNIGTGEKLSVIFGKIKKWFSDLGTAAFKNVPASGNASNTEVVLGNDSRLSAGASAVQDVTVDGVSVVNSSTKVAAVPNASTTAKGAVQLEDSHTSTSTTKAATPNSVKDAYDLANTANSGLANKQDKPGSATEDNIATFNGSKSTKDSGKSFLPSTSTWDGTSENKIPTAKAVQVQLDGKLTDSPRVSQRAPTADEKAGGMTDAYYKVAYDTDKTIFMDVTDNRSGLWARRSGSIGDWLVWMDNNGDGHLNGTSTKAQGYEVGGGIDLALQGKQATCMFRVETPEWNDLVESGFYEVRSSSSAGTNHSPEGGLIKCIVVKAVNASNQTGVSQIAMGDYVYTRFKPSNSSTWSDWKVMPYSNKFAASDSDKMVGIDANGLLANTGVRTSEALKAVNYNRVHVEAMRGWGGSGIATYYNVGLYRYDGGSSILVPTQTGALNVGELVGGTEAIVKYSPQDWTPTSYNCEDFLIVNSGVDSEKLYDALQLGMLLSDTSCRRFTLRLANISDKDWHIMICHTFGNGHEGVQIPESSAYNSAKYSGNFTPIINKLVRAEKYYDVLIRPDKCVKVDIMISSMVYNSTSGLMAVIDTDEPYDPA